MLSKNMQSKNDHIKRNTLYYVDNLRLCNYRIWQQQQ